MSTCPQQHGNNFPSWREHGYNCCRHPQTIGAQVRGEGEWIRNPSCPTRRLSGGVSANVLPMQHVRWRFDLGANGQLYPRPRASVAAVITQLPKTRPAIIVVSPGVLLLQHTSDDADCIDRIKTLAEIINSHAKRVIRRKATQRRTWAAAMERPFSCEVGTCQWWSMGRCSNNRGLRRTHTRSLISDRNTR